MSLVTLLFLRSGHCDIVRFLLDQGVDVNTADNDDWTSLHSAAQAGHLECVRVLIKAGADLTTRASGRWTALHFAAHW